MSDLELEIRRDGGQRDVLSVEVKTTLTIGRSEDNALVLEDGNVSRYHCVIAHDGHRWVIDDLNSMNGITVNGERTGSLALKRDDLISIRPFTLKVVSVSELHGETSILETDAAVFGEEVDEDATVINSGRGNEKSDLYPDDEDATHVKSANSQYMLAIKSGEGADRKMTLQGNILVGRDSGCDVVIDDPLVSRQHLRLESIGGNVRFTNLSSVNVTHHNGEVSGEGSLAHGDTLRIGKTELGFVQKGGALKKRLGLLEDRRVRLGALGSLLVFSLIAAGAMLTGDREKSGADVSQEVGAGQAISAERKAGEAGGLSEKDLREKRNFHLYFDEAMKLFNAGSYRAAITRLEMCLQINSDDADAVALLAETRKKAKEKIRLEEERKREMVAGVAKAETLLAKAVREVEGKEYSLAIGTLDNLDAALESIPDNNELGQKGRQLREQVTATMEQDKERRALEAEARSGMESDVRETMARAETDLKASNLLAAREQYLKVVMAELDIEETSVARKQLRGINVQLEEQSDQALGKAESAKKKNDFPAALIELQQVLEIFPDHKRAREIYDAIMLVQVEKAKRFYRRGLVYEGINNLKKAKSDWKKARDLVPVKGSEYNEKSKNKLAEYSH